MTKLIERKCRLCRSSEKKLFLKGERCFSAKCPIAKKGAVAPGQRSQVRKKKKSDYGVRLIEAQKLKRTYDVRETKMKNYFNRAKKEKQATGEALFRTLESRLDNVVYRLGFAPSRRFARQLVSHKHILVDGKNVNIPSFLLKAESVITLDPKMAELDLVKKSLSNKDYVLPVWLKREATSGKILHLPKLDEIETDVDEQLIIEFYSRR